MEMAVVRAVFVLTGVPVTPSTGAAAVRLASMAMRASKVELCYS